MLFHLARHGDTRTKDYRRSTLLLNHFKPYGLLLDATEAADTKPVLDNTSAARLPATALAAVSEATAAAAENRSRAFRLISKGLSGSTAALSRNRSWSIGGMFQSLTRSRERHCRPALA